MVEALLLCNICTAAEAFVSDHLLRTISIHIPCLVWKKIRHTCEKIFELVECEDLSLNFVPQNSEEFISQIIRKENQNAGIFFPTVPLTLTLFSKWSSSCSFQMRCSNQFQFNSNKLYCLRLFFLFFLINVCFRNRHLGPYFSNLFKLKYL